MDKKNIANFNKKKIVHIITRLINGGAEKTIISCNYSASIGNEVFLIIGPYNDKEIIDNSIRK